ncbi:unnamed protein product, partial [Iphiclides podalirius]
MAAAARSFQGVSVKTLSVPRDYHTMPTCDAAAVTDTRFLQAETAGGHFVMRFRAHAKWRWPRSKLMPRWRFVIVAEQLVQTPFIASLKRGYSVVRRLWCS